MAKEVKTESPPDIGWQEAMNVLEGVKGRYQAFERLESVARLMAGHEQYLREAQQRVDEADQAIFQKSRVLKELQTREQAMEVVLKEAQERYERERTEADAVIHKAHLDYDKLLADMETSQAERKNQLETEFYDRKRVLEKELSDLEARKAHLEQSIERLKKSIGGL